MRLIKAIAYYFFGVLSTRLIQFLFLPLYTAYISTADMGYYDYIVSVIAVAMPLLYHAAQDGVLRLGLDARTKLQRRVFFSTSAIANAALSVFYIVVGCLLWVVFKVPNSEYMAPMVVSQALMQYWSSAARALENNRAFSVGYFTASVVSIGVNIALIVGLGMGLEALFIANIASNIVTTIVIEMQIKVLRRVKLKHFSFDALRSLRKYTAPFIVATAAWQFYMLGGRILVPFLVGLNDSGLYSIASRFPAVLSVLTMVYSMAWQEELIKRADDADRDRYFNDMFERLVSLCLGALLFVMPMTALLYPIMVRGGYAGSINLVPILYIDSIMGTITLHLTSIFIMAKNGKYNLLNTVTSALVSALSMVVLSRFFGLYGVAIGSLVGSVYRFALSNYLGRKHVAVKTPLVKLAVLLAVYALVSVLSMQLSGFALVALAVLGAAAAVWVNMRSITLALNMLRSGLKVFSA